MCTWKPKPQSLTASFGTCVCWGCAEGSNQNSHIWPLSCGNQLSSTHTCTIFGPNSEGKMHFTITIRSRCIHGARQPKGNREHTCRRHMVDVHVNRDCSLVQSVRSLNSKRGMNGKSSDATHTKIAPRAVHTPKLITDYYLEGGWGALLCLSYFLARINFRFPALLQTLHIEFIHLQLWFCASAYMTWE